MASMAFVLHCSYLDLDQSSFPHNGEFMRPSCLECARKHIAESEVLMREAVMGYAEHAWLAIGHLSQAEAELLEKFPDLAHIVRAERINYLEGLEYQKLMNEDGKEYLGLTSKYNIDTIDLIYRITVTDIEHEEKINR